MTQMGLIVDLLGAPNEHLWPDYALVSASARRHIAPQPYNHIGERLPSLSAAGRDLLHSLLTYDPSRRATADDALAHEYFRQRPIPTLVADLPTYPHLRDAAPSRGRDLRRKK